MGRAGKKPPAATYDTPDGKPADAHGPLGPEPSAAVMERPWPGDENENGGGKGSASPERKPALEFDAGGAWPAEVCGRIRRWKQAVESLKSRRVNRMKDQLAVREEIAELGLTKPTEQLKDKALEFVTLEFEIDRLKDGIAKATNKLLDVIENADQGRLFEEEEEAEEDEQLTLDQASD